MECGIIIASAGQGKRMGLGQNKLFYKLNNKPILIHTIEKFQNIPWVNEIVIVANPNEIETIETMIREHNLIVSYIVAGGEERQDSVENGLSKITSEYVMIHDGARPFITTEKIEELFHFVQREEAVVLGVPVKDTVKVIDKTGYIKETPERKSLWAIQTPQAFRVSLLKDAYNNAKQYGFRGTDDASLIEKLGRKVKVINGDYTNIKVTTKEDLMTGQAILSEYRGENNV